jgi:hypothetical protein
VRQNIRSLHDNELLRRYRTPGTETVAAEAFIEIYRRYRARARNALEAEGLDRREAEQRLGAVFIRALDRRADIPAGMPLAELLMKAAREVATDPDWMP